MECPACQSSNPDGQKFCGSCGHELEVTCPQCQAANPPHYKFCGQCGTALSLVGRIAIVRSGLITQVNEKALDLLGYEEKEMHGKPFSLFVDRVDMVIFFSHLNELLSTRKRQIFEITLKHKNQGTICVQLEISVGSPQASPAHEVIDIGLSEIAKDRVAATQMQSQLELLGLVFSVTNNISTVGKAHLAHSVTDGLKKIGLFTKAQRCFIYRINRSANSLDLVYEWENSGGGRSKGDSSGGSVPLSKVKQIIMRLRQSKIVVVRDTDRMSRQDRQELLAWHKSAAGSALFYLVYSGKNPVGVIGAIKPDTDEEWTSDGIALIKFFGDFLADRLAAVPEHRKVLDGTADPHAGEKTPHTAPASREDGTADPKAPPAPRSKKASNAEAGTQSKTAGASSVPSSRPMLLEKFLQREHLEEQRVFLRDDGLVLLTCPDCGIQESVSLGRFDKLGSTISVHCSCNTRFAAVLEKRRYYRKSVRLDGYFSLSGDLAPDGAIGNIWGQMIVTDLSKAGLRFSSEKAHLVHLGDLLLVRFNLDNTNQAAIVKSARVISVSRQSVGCRFEGNDNYDITLGFYFM